MLLTLSHGFIHPSIQPANRSSIHVILMDCLLLQDIMTLNKWMELVLIQGSGACHNLRSSLTLSLMIQFLLWEQILKYWLILWKGSKTSSLTYLSMAIQLNGFLPIVRTNSVYVTVHLHMIWRVMNFDKSSFILIYPEIGQCKL